MTKIKRITIINQYIGSPFHGMEYRHYYLAKNLIKLGYKVTLVSASYSHLFSILPKTNKTFTKEKIDDIDYIWVSVPSYKSSKSLGRIWNMFYFSWKLNFLKDIKPSHIIVSSPSLFPIKRGRKWANQFNTKLLFEIRDIWPLTLTELSSLKNTHPLIMFMHHYEKYGYKNSDRVISLLPKAKEHYMTNGMKEEKFRYLPNGIEMEETLKSKLSIEILSKIPKNKFIIAYSGTVGIANNLDYLVDIANELKNNSDIHFIILGKGGEKDRLVSKVKEFNMDNFTFIDPIPKEQVFLFLKEIDVAFISLLPEKIFRFGVSPNKMFDYMYAKKPIIWAIEAGNNLVEESNSGITVPLNKIEIFKKEILKLFTLDKEKLNKLGTNGYNFIQEKHSYETLAKRLIKIIEEKDV